MKTTTDILETKLVIDGKDYALTMKKAGGDLGKYEKKTEGSLTKLRKNWLVYTAAIGGVLAIGKKLVDLAAEQERVEKRLSFAVKSSGLAVASTTAHLTKYAASLQKMTGYGDEAIIPIQTMLIQLGRLSGIELDRATRLTLDFASALGIDMKAAGILMAKAATGSTEALSRYGIVLDANIPKSEKFTELLKVMEQKFGGTAKADLDTYAGSMRAFKSSLGDFGELLGQTVLPALTGMLKVLTGILRVFSEPVPDDSFMALTAGVMQEGKSGGLSSAKVGAFMRSDRARTTGFAGPPAPPPPLISADQLKASKRTALLGVSGMGITQDEEGNLLSGEFEGYGNKKRLDAAIEQAQKLTEIESDGQEISLENLIYFEKEKTRISKTEAALRAEALRTSIATGLGYLTAAFPKMKAFQIGEAGIQFGGALMKALNTPFPANLAAWAQVTMLGARAKSIIEGGSPGGSISSVVPSEIPAASIPMGNEQDINIVIQNADKLVNLTAFGEMMGDVVFQTIEAAGGRGKNIKISYEEI